MPTEVMSEEESALLLRLLHRHVMLHAVEDSISALAADLAMSMDRTTDEQDAMRRDIESFYDSHASATREG